MISISVATCLKYLTKLANQRSNKCNMHEKCPSDLLSEEVQYFHGLYYGASIEVEFWNSGCIKTQHTSHR